MILIRVFEYKGELNNYSMKYAIATPDFIQSVASCLLEVDSKSVAASDDPEQKSWIRKLKDVDELTQMTATYFVLYLRLMNDKRNKREMLLNGETIDS